MRRVPRRTACARRSSIFWRRASWARTFVDAYAGTGAVGIEALSRGAAHAWFLERNRLRAGDDPRKPGLAPAGSRATVAAGPVLLSLPRYPAEIVFLDPPYDKEREYTAALGRSVGIRAATDDRAALDPARASRCSGPLRRTRIVKQGDNALSFYTVPG